MLLDLLIGASLTISLASAAPSAPATPDPLAVELARWRDFTRAHGATDDGWQALRGAAEPALEQAGAALAAGRRWQALARLAAARTILAAEAYRAALPAGAREDLEQLEREWRRLAPALGAPLADQVPPGLAAVPAAARAVAEAALAEVDPYYRASLEYGRSTVADSGYFYLGAAAAQLELARFCATLGGPERAGAAPPLRPLEVEIEALEGELLAAYRPPSSIDDHPAFIRASALVKQARELDAAGLRFGALYRLLEARLRVSLLTRPESAGESDTTRRRARALLAELDASSDDASLARLFVESALAAAADPAPEARGGETARAILDDVLPLYAAAVGPAPPRPEQPPAEVTVTLVRWPYT